MVHPEQDRTRTLKREHRGISRQLSVVQGGVMASLPSEELKRSIDLLESLLETHFMGEEESLYKPLKQRLGRSNPVDGMTREHRTIRKRLGELDSSMARCLADSGRAGELRSCFDSLQRELGEHIQREEAVLFWLADLKL